MKIEGLDELNALNLHFENQPLTFEAIEANDATFYSVCIGKKPIAHFSLSDFPHAYKAAISYDVLIAAEFRNKGLGSLLHNARLIMLKKLAYNRVFCTVNENNVAELAILRRYGWTRLEYMNNEHTSALWVKAL